MKIYLSEEKRKQCCLMIGGVWRHAWVIMGVFLDPPMFVNQRKSLSNAHMYVIFRIWWNKKVFNINILCLKNWLRNNREFLSKSLHLFAPVPREKHTEATDIKCFRFRLLSYINNKKNLSQVQYCLKLAPTTDHVVRQHLKNTPKHLSKLFFIMILEIKMKQEINWTIGHNCSDH